MDYSIQPTQGALTETLANLPSACLVVGAYQDGQLTASATAVDTLSGGLLGRLIARGDLEAVAGKSLDRKSVV